MSRSTGIKYSSFEINSSSTPGNNWGSFPLISVGSISFGSLIMECSGITIAPENSCNAAAFLPTGKKYLFSTGSLGDDVVLSNC